MLLNRPVLLLLLVFVFQSNVCFSADSLDTVINNIQWIKGPKKASIGTMAEIEIPAGYIFANGDDTRKVLEAMQNLTSGKELALIANEDLSDFAVFFYDETGYIKDDEKSKLDADAMLAQIKEGVNAGNEEKKKRGWETMSVDGWDIPPRYNSQTNNLEWAIKFNNSKGGSSVNFNTKYLGRYGVMKVVLVSDPNTIKASINNYQQVMTKFSFTQGSKYSEYVQGDKVAKYGLSALVVGGAAAAVVKSGFGKYLGKLLIPIGLAVVAFAKTIFEKISGLFRRKQ